MAAPANTVARPINVLLVENNASDAERILGALAEAGVAVQARRVETEDAFLAALEEQPELILSDLSLPQFDGLRAVEMVRQRGLDTPFIVICGSPSEELLVQSIKSGADDYLSKDRLVRLGSAVRAALESKRLRDHQRGQEEQLRRAAESQSAILNALPASIALLDAQGVIVAVNEAWRRFARDNFLPGTDPGVGRNYLEVCEQASGEDAPQARAAAAGIRRVLRGEEPEFSLEYPCHSPAEPRWFRLMVTPLPEGPPGGAVVMHVDITQRREAEEDLRRRHEQHQRQHEALQELTRLVTTAEEVRAPLVQLTETAARVLAAGRVSYWRLNPGRSAIVCEDLFDARAARHSAGQELKAAQFPAYFQALEQNKIIAADDARRDRRTREFTPVYLDPLGITSMLDTPVLVAGRLEGVFCVEHTGPPRQWTPAEQNFALALANLVALLLARLAQEQSEARLRGIIENKPECVKIMALDGKLLDINPAGLRMIEVGDSATLMGRPVLHFVHPEDRQLFVELHRRAAGGETGEAQFRLITQQGTQRWVESRAAPLRTADGQITSVVSVTRDITGRKEAEEQLAAARTRLSDLIQSLEGIVYEADAATFEFKFVSARAERILGYPVLQWYDEPHFWVNHLHPEDRERAVRYCRECTARKEDHTLECRMLRADGSVVWVRDLVRYVEQPGGRAVLRGLMVDITEQKRAEQALRQSEARFTAVFRSNPTPLAINTIHEGRLLEVNDRFCEWIGARREELIGRTIPELNVWANLAERAPVIERVLREGSVHNHETRLRRRNGELRDVLLFFERIDLPEAPEPVLLAQVVDVTERKQAAQKLREQAELLDKAQDAILVRDLEHRITYWNKGAERLYGWTADEVAGRSIQELLFRDTAAFLTAADAVLAQGEWAGELTQFTRDGREVSVGCRWALVRDPAGQPRAVLCINTDLTEHKKLQAQLLRTQRMESIGTLAGGIAHDLNNVLAPILMSISLLKMNEQDEERLKILASIEGSARRGADLVRQVLSFARGMEGERVPVKLAHLGQEIARIIRDTFPKNITFELESARDLWTVEADPTQMHQVLMNLCVNARDAMPAGGRITLSLANMVLDEVYSGMNPQSRPGNYVVLAVQDTGTGIPASVQERMFEPFFTTKAVGQGTGLGLATVLTIVKSHGGFINVYSEPGKGATFKVYLPAQTTRDAAEKTAVEQTQLPRGRGELILVVDDEESIRIVARKTLERFGYRVLLASHGAEAVALFARHRGEIAAVLTDMAMPVMDGPSTILALKAMDPQVKIIGSSGLNANGGVAKAIGAGVQHFVPKPYTAERMLRTLHQVLHGGG
jgi:PAS domain S-box-containing protein